MVFRFGRIELDEDAYEVRRDGVVQRVEPKVLDVLLYLVSHPNRLVPKSELLDRVWPDTVVAESALTRAVSLARAAIGDTARGQSMIETVSGRGYRLRVAADVDAPPPAVVAEPARRSMGQRIGFVFAGLACVVLFVTWLSWPTFLALYMDVLGLADPPEYPPLPDRPSVAILPFVDLGPDNQHAYLGDGIADEVTVGLARLREIFVISRGSAFIYRGAAVDVKRVGRELGVRYVVEGSVRAAGEQAVVAAQLVDASTGFQLWTGRYERGVGDVLRLQSEISAEILQALGVRIADAEIERGGGEAATDSDAYAAYFLARIHWYRFTDEDNRKAEELLERALALDPLDSRLQALLASTEVAFYGFGWDLSHGRLERGRTAALRAIELDPFSSRAYAALAAVHLWSGDGDEALAAARRAVDLGPNSDLCMGVKAMTEAAAGNIREAVQSLNRALRLNPRQPSPYWMILGYMYEASGRSEQAVSIWEQVRNSSPDMIPPRVELLRHYDQQQRYQEARVLAREILRTNPGFTTAAAVRLAPRRLGVEEAGQLRVQLQRAGIP